MRSPVTGPAHSSDGELPGGSPAPRSRTDGSDGFSIAVREDAGTLYLTLTGKLDWAYIGYVESALARISAVRTRHVVLDLRDLTSLDIAGLKTILRANERAHTEAFDLIVVRPRGLANRIFTLTRAGAQLKMADRIPPS